MDWSEAADWVGIVLTPFTSFRFEKSDNNPVFYMPLTFEKTVVKLSPRAQMGASRQLWALTWPFLYYRQFLVKKVQHPMEENWGKLTRKDIKESWYIARDNLLDELCLKRPMPASVISKYDNTLAFFDSMKEKIIEYDYNVIGFQQPHILIP